MARGMPLKCVFCARTPGPNEDGLVLCRCKGRYYCNEECKKADERNHGADCRTIELLAKPGNMVRAPGMIKPRDRASERIATQQNVIYHLILVIRGKESPKRARYIGAFVELDGLEQKIQETVADFNSVVPSGAFLSELLDSPVAGLAGVEEVRIPLCGLEESITFLIPLEKQPYVQHCYRNTMWSLEKLLYIVVIDFLHPDFLHPPDLCVTKVMVEATFGSQVAANAWVDGVVERWGKEKGREAKAIPVNPYSVRGVQTLRKTGTETKRVRIFTRTLLQAGATKGTDGETTVVVPRDRSGFAKRIRVLDHMDPP